jgi:hypothetical protein
MSLRRVIETLVERIACRAVSRVCEARFFSGEFWLLKGSKDEATRGASSFDLAILLCDEG